MEDKELIARISDLIKSAERKNHPCFSFFLTPIQQAFIQNNRELRTLLKDVSLTFEGGYENAERKIAVLCPKCYVQRINFPISVISVEYKGDRLSHRDILGALMGLGIKRDTLGDIIESSDPQSIICENKISEYIINNFTKAGRSNISCKYGEILSPPAHNFKEINSTVASLRLDGILSEGFNVSRGKASELIKSGLVYVNWVLATSPSKEIKEGDSISVRGKGKIILDKVLGQSKKGRILIRINKYI